MKKILFSALVLFLFGTLTTQAALVNVSTIYDTVANTLSQVRNAATASFQASSFTATSTTAPSTISNLNQTIYIDGTNFAFSGAGIQSAINTVCAQGGGRVVLGNASYNVSTQITVCSNLTITGNGSSTTLYPQSNFFTFFIDNKDHVVIENIAIDGYVSTINTNATGIRIKNSRYITINGNKLTNMTAFGVFIDASGASTSEKIWVTNNYVQGEGTNDVIGGGPQNSTGAKVKDIFIINNHVVQDCTINTYCNAFDLVAMNNFVVQGNIFYGIVQPGSEQFPHTNLNISGNNIFPALGVTTTALYISTNDSSTATSSRVSITNNIIEDGTIEVFGTTTALISDIVVSGNNILAGALTDGITFMYTKNVSVTGNTINGGETGIEIATSSDFMISGNAVTGANYGIKTDDISSGIAIGVNRFSDILNTDVENQPAVHIIRSSSAQTADLAFRDTNYDFDPTGGKFYISDYNDKLGIYRGVAGLNGSERLQIDATKVTFGEFAVQDRTLGVFNGTDLMRFRIAGNSFINNGYNFGFGTATATEEVHISGGLRLTGNFMDSTNATGTIGQLLQSTGTSTQWVSTSTLGFTGGGSGSNWSIVSGGLRTSTTTDFAQASYIIASSATATSTFSGKARFGSIDQSLSNTTVTVQGTLATPSSMEDVLTLERPFNSGVFRGRRASISVGASDAVSAGATRLNFNLGSAGITSATDSTLPNTTVLTLVGDGEAGIGINNPLATLDIASTTPTFRLTNTIDGAWAPGIVNGLIEFYSQDTSNIGVHTVSSISSVNDIAGTPTSPSGALAFSTAINAATTSERMRLTSAGFLGIGTSVPSTTLHVVGTTTLATTSITALDLTALTTNTSGNALCIVGTSVVTAGNTTCVTSSARFKQNITPLNDWRDLLDINVVEFNYKPEYADTVRDAGGKRIGFIAEQIEQVDPQLVQYDTEGNPLSVHFDGITAKTVLAIQEIQKEIDGMTGKSQKSAQDNWQWVIICLLFLLILGQQYQIAKLKK